MSPSSSSSHISATSSQSSNPSRLVDDNFLEQGLAAYRFKATNSLSISSLRKSKFSRAAYDSVGISSDVRHAFYWDSKNISVFRLGDLKASPESIVCSKLEDLSTDFTHGESIFDVVMSTSFLVVVTNKRAIIVNLIHRWHFPAIAYNDWDPAGVACHESSSRFVLALGHGRGSSLKSSEGLIHLYGYELGNSQRKLSLRSNLKLPTQNRPREVSLSRDARIVTSVTTIQSRVFVWDLDENLTPLTKPFDFVKNHYSAERYQTGITSTSIYTSSSNNHYLFCTTSPSSERHKNSGEWSFILPLPKVQTSATPRIRPPNSTIHNLEQLKHHRVLRAGAVSSKYNIFAALEDNGRISILPLVASPQGGICGKDSGMKVLSETVGARAGILRFTPDEERLIVVDAKGKIAVVDFERDTSQA